MWIIDFIKECRVWREVNRVYRKNREDFLKLGLKKDWFGKIYKVINRDVTVELGSNEDEMFLRNELMEIQNLLVKENIIDLLAYELKPLEEDDGKTYEHGYLIVFTPAYRLDRQYVSLRNILIMGLVTIGIIGGVMAFLYYV